MWSWDWLVLSCSGWIGVGVGGLNQCRLHAAWLQLCWLTYRVNLKHLEQRGLAELSGHFSMTLEQPVTMLLIKQTKYDDISTLCVLTERRETVTALCCSRLRNVPCSGISGCLNKSRRLDQQIHHQQVFILACFLFHFKLKPERTGMDWDHLTTHFQQRRQASSVGSACCHTPQRALYISSKASF